MEYFDHKITSVHLKRKAILYIRQSTIRQVYENVESTLRQYALKEKLIRIGWQEESITVIDCDLGQSGAESSGRDGFKQLVADVGSGEVGAVASIECSRLSRNSCDWGRLMEICAITQTVLIDDDGIYDPNNFNDRLLLGLKGTMSEAELHFLHARMRGGALNKARRGELKIPLPIGYVYDEAGAVIKDPNLEIQNAVRLFFEVFRICGSAHRMLSYYRKNGYRIPKNPCSGFNSREIAWVYLTSARAIDMLHNPAYAGIYAYGQHQEVHTINGRKIRVKPMDEWHVYIEGHHEGYISCEEYDRNQKKLTANNINSVSVPPPREGNALMQGIVICGKCGAKMSVRYKRQEQGDIPYYVCDDQTTHYTGGSLCQCVNGSALDKAVSILLLERLTPMAVRTAIQVQKELEQRRAASDNYFILKVERARYDVELARKRYMNVDPSNRLVAFELEKLWNLKMGELAKAEEELRNHENSKKDETGDLDVRKLLGLPDNMGDIWKNKHVNIQDKKRILRCLIEDVTITKGSKTTRLGVCFKGGTSTVVECINPPMKYTTWTTSEEVLDIIRKESTCHTADEISEILTNAGYKAGKGGELTKERVTYLQRTYGIPSYQEYLHNKGYLTAREKAVQLGIRLAILHQRKNTGEFKGKVFRASGKGNYMFAPDSQV
jgi:DNA invertase Pin-like site-specific DNA recombinase